MSKQHQSTEQDKQIDWAKNAEDALKKAETDIADLKKEAQEELRNSKGQFNHSDE